MDLGARARNPGESAGDRVKVHVLEREQWLRATQGRVVDFFADAHNLDAITPPWVNFQVLTPHPIEMRAGLLLNYRLRLAGVPLRWRTRIESWDPPHGFVDVAERSPYALWEHQHRFEPKGDGVLVADRVRYALPLAPLGELAHPIVRAALAAIFDYRFARVREVFGC
jgi:ligand-binding SRPBCC domain-containing protein